MNYQKVSLDNFVKSYGCQQLSSQQNKLLMGVQYDYKFIEKTRDTYLVANWTNAMPSLSSVSPFNTEGRIMSIVCSMSTNKLFYL